MKDRCLFIALQYLTPNYGITRKVMAQVDAIRDLGKDVSLMYFESELNTKYLNFEGNRIPVKSIPKSYSLIEKYVFTIGFKVIYIRYCHSATRAMICFLRKCRMNGIKVFLEIPTYPYDGEIKIKSLIDIFDCTREHFYRKQLASCVDYIVTFSDDRSIFRVPTIPISNAPSSLHKIKKRKEDNNAIFVMIAVANIGFWHGYDRLINGLADYYQNKENREVHLIIVGEGDKYVTENLQKLVYKKKLQDKVSFYGLKFGRELDALFDMADVAIGSLGRHRSKVYDMKSLKNVEYAMRGIPFVYSENNEDFDGKGYVLKVPSDESNVDIKSICSFVDNITCTPEDIHSTVSEFTWYHQLKKVFAVLK